MENKSFLECDLIEKSNEVMTSLNCFRAAGVSALREIIREQIHTLDWSMCYRKSVLQKLEEGLGDMQEELSNSDFDLYYFNIALAVDEAVKGLNYTCNIIDGKGNVIGNEPMPYTGIADRLLSIFNEYLETYYVA